jgi:UDP-N-acetyl-D-glucosamine dehydrogenase
MNRQVAIIGLGYVGLPIAVAAAQSGYIVNGIDKNEKKLGQLRGGISPIEDISNSDVSKLINDGRLEVSADFSGIKDSQVILICVPTPLDSNNKPDLSYVEAASKDVAKNLSKGALVVLESTVEPGTTRNILVPLLENGSGLKRTEFQVAFSPERIDPSNSNWGVRNTPKLVAGLTNESCANAIAFYSKFIDEVAKCDSLEIAETAKLLENTFRLINISFINELSIFCQKLGIDVNNVIKAAATKPYGFMPFYPSIGVGGHCIPVDPLYLANKAREVGAPTRFIELADQINQEMPGYFAGRAEEKVGGLKSKKVLVVGVSYKPNVADVRETPVEALILGLKNKGAEVFWHDDLVKEWNGEKSVALSNEYDLAIIATPHTYLDLTKLGDMPILNTRGSI